MAMGGFHCLVFMSVLLILSSCGMADKAQDRQECTNQLVGLATCLPYVSGTAKAPTPDCCNGLKQVLKNDKKCLCVIIRDRNDPDLGLNINVTLALGLPSVCHASANISQCPELLHMDPNSPEAKIFYQFGRSSDQGAPASSPSPAPASGGSSTGANASSSSSRKGCCSGKRWLGLEMISCGILLLYFIGSSYLFI